MFSKFLLDHIISYAGELFVLFANVFIVDLGATYISCVIGKTIRMIMIKLRMFSYNFAYTIMSDVLY